VCLSHIISNSLNTGIRLMKALLFILLSTINNNLQTYNNKQCIRNPLKKSIINPVCLSHIISNNLNTGIRLMKALLFILLSSLSIDLSLSCILSFHSPERRLISHLLSNRAQQLRQATCQLLYTRVQLLGPVTHQLSFTQVQQQRQATQLR